MISKLLDADALGIRLEIIGGLPVWEPHPLWKHQKAIDRIRATIETTPPAKHAQKSCDCIHASDVYVKFTDGSLKRPDISIFCREPEEEDKPVTLVPEAVIEVLSKGYEAKDLEIAPRFYLSQGVKDVVVFDPYTLVVLHVRKDRADRMVSPVEIEFECGCRCAV